MVGLGQLLLSLALVGLMLRKLRFFLISFWVRAQVAANRVVNAPRHRQIVGASLLVSIIG